METTYKHIIRSIEHVLSVLFALLVLDVLGQVFARYLLNTSYSFTEELARFSLIWLTVLGAAYLSGKNEHLAMDFLLNRLPEKKKTNRRILIQALTLCFALVVMIVGGGNLVYTTLELGQQSPAMGLPLGFVYAIIPLSGVLICYFAVFHITELFHHKN